MKQIAAWWLPVLVVGYLVYTRFAGLSWGLPYLMHPDERNMVTAMLELSCTSITSPECLNPHFYAYGQLPLYLGMVCASFIAFVSHQSWIFTARDAALGLRAISATASVLTSCVLFLIYTRFHHVRTIAADAAAALLCIFIPAFVQFSHFGTTESLLMLSYISLIYLAVLYIRQYTRLESYILASGVLLGLAAGIKLSAVSFAAIPVVALIMTVHLNRRIVLLYFFALLRLAAITTIFFFLASPHNIIHWQDFLGSMKYESSVGFGTARVFYTRQFEYSLPILFQIFHIFPYAFGGPFCILAVLAFFFLPWNKVYIFLRLQLLIFFVPNAFLYAKWTRFISPIFPLMVVMGMMYLVRLMRAPHTKTGVAIHFIGLLIASICAIPGIAYLAIYQRPDVRFVASRWIYSAIPSGSALFFETANVVDIPIPDDQLDRSVYADKVYEGTSFNLYEVDADLQLAKQLDDQIRDADYIIIPSRRVFANHTCFRFIGEQAGVLTHGDGYEKDLCNKLAKRYPVLHKYYTRLLSGQMGFEQIAEFHSFPRISFLGKTLVELPDEAAEETWTVFDHPVIRVFGRK